MTNKGSSSRFQSWIVRDGEFGRVETDFEEESTICRIQPSFADQTAHLERSFILTEVIKDFIDEFRGELFAAHETVWKSLSQAVVLSKLRGCVVVVR
jgi:hypothetical protein